MATLISTVLEGGQAELKKHVFVELAFWLFSQVVWLRPALFPNLGRTP